MLCQYDRKDCLKRNLKMNFVKQKISIYTASAKLMYFTIQSILVVASETQSRCNLLLKIDKAYCHSPEF